MIRQITDRLGICRRWSKVTFLAQILTACLSFASESSACIAPSATNLADYLYSDQIVIAEIVSTTRGSTPEAHFLIGASNTEYLRGSGPKQIEFTLNMSGTMPLPSLQGRYGRALIGLGAAETDRIEKDGGLWVGRVSDGMPWVLRALCDTESLILFERDDRALFAAVLGILSSPDPLQEFACLGERFHVKSEAFQNGQLVVCETER